MLAEALPAAVASPLPAAARVPPAALAAAVVANPPVAAALRWPPPFVSRVPRNPDNPFSKAELLGRTGGKSN
jgi:hypothetical protein